jgi:glutamate synthase domain-containing protein 2/glutamate synthase domain-containing protein 1/glutamate synthase domain-containing protein 3
MPLPRPDGLYNPAHEHDACGVGFVANIQGKRSHRIIEQGLTILLNLEHRGACGCDPETGDGAGILLQIPHRMLQTAMDGRLPEEGMYGVGMVFLPRDRVERAICEAIIEAVVEEEGQLFLGWRTVPTDNTQIGTKSREVEPVIRQFFVGAHALAHKRPDSAFPPAADFVNEEGDAFERKLYVIRKRIERKVAGKQLREAGYFYIPSLSSRTIVYKGLLLANQIGRYYLDLQSEEMETALALVHQRFSTNTFPTWDLAHPYRMIAHNGEINTLRGNRNWMRARQARLTSSVFGDDVRKLIPLVNEEGSDSATLDNALELLVRGGRSLPHAIMMLIPEAWGSDEHMDPDRRAFYEYHACMMEPWDGPAAVAFSDGRLIGAVLDRNGLRPARYLVTKDNLAVMASETGVLDIPEENIAHKWRLQPGRIFLVDTVAGRIVSDEELKQRICRRAPYRQWLSENKIELRDLPDPPHVYLPNRDTMLDRQQAFGYTLEDMKYIIGPMAVVGEQPLGSMGNDTPLAVLSDRPQLLYSYFKQLFAQVTNPPIDPIREELVMSLAHYIGANGSLLEETPENCRQLRLESAILTNVELEKLRALDTPDFRARTLSILFDPTTDGPGMETALHKLCRQASKALAENISVIILSDRGVDRYNAPIPALLALSAVHNHLIREGTRTNVALVLETGEPREVMHFALLVGYGASAINPYLALETVTYMARDGELTGKDGSPLSVEKATYNYIKAINKGLLKTMAKMGISTLQSYRGAQIFEAVGLDGSVIEKYFTHTPSRIGGVDLDVIAQEVLARHRFAFPARHVAENLQLDPGGHYQWRHGGEYHQVNPESVAGLQHAVQTEIPTQQELAVETRADGRSADNGSTPPSAGRGGFVHGSARYDSAEEFATTLRQSPAYARFRKWAAEVDDQSRRLATLRGLFALRKAETPIPLDEVEPASEIVKRFVTGAMSLGSISREAHETLAIAMNRLGGRSNTGEGGEDPVRYVPEPNGDSRRSRIKQVASGRFGVTTHYLVNADELQIKMAQGAKPGEGGELPGHKVDRYIAQVRHTTPGVTLISPPPHHDIYSIEDLAQLIFDLKNANPQARISVKLVAEVGVGTVAAGVAKAHADHILISGYEGGTGASPLSSIKHAGIPWELGLAETQQVLVKNDLRGRVVLQTDGQLKTGRDVVVAALLGAEEFGFSTMPLIAMGCVMMRVCHLNTCPVGIATQDPVLRARFAGKPEHVVNYFFLVAEHVRELMAELGFRTFDEMVGRVDRLETRGAVNHWKARGVDVSLLLARPEVGEDIPIRHVMEQDHGLDEAIDHHLISACRAAIEEGAAVEIEGPIRNANRTVGTMLSGEVAKRYGEQGLPDDTIRISFRGSAGQSFGAFLARGITLRLEGDANDYLGKGLSGGKIVVYPPAEATYAAHENIIAGNTLLYGATSGTVFLRGVVGERFAVRNSGAHAVVEGAGDHCCEYMTGGVVVVLGRTGRNFAAGMSGGIAFVWDSDGTFRQRLNFGHGSILLEPVVEAADQALLFELVEAHYSHTGSQRARELLDHWDRALPQFLKVWSVEYRDMLAELARQQLTQGEELVGV